MRNGLIVWIGVGVLLVAGVVYWGTQTMIVCWDGIEVNEELLIEQCGITEDDYYSGDFMESGGCPEESGAIQYVGGCDPDWTLISGAAGGFGLAYLVLSGLFVGIRKVVQRNKT